MKSQHLPRLVGIINSIEKSPIWAFRDRAAHLLCAFHNLNLNDLADINAPKLLALIQGNRSGTHPGKLQEALDKCEILKNENNILGSLATTLLSLFEDEKII